MKMKMIVLTAIMTLSFSVVTEAAISSGTEHEKEIGLPSEEIRPNLSDIPFIDILENTISLFYPPLDLLKEETVTYKVEEGDTLYRIALNHGMTLQELKSLNDLEEDLIYPGDVLTVSEEDGENNLGNAGTFKVAAVISEKAPEITTETSLAPKEPAFNVSVSSPPESTGAEMTVTATAYTAYCTGCSGTTAYGIDLRSNPNQKVIAVDPSIIPLGTKVWVEGYGEAIAGDVGSAIKGHKIDVFIPTYESAMEWGVKKVKLKIIK
ncbi:3D domain-containing protein [Sporosarcina sp. SAFN-015]|uniref:3D domain-containing protein n=1 Tax=Sporosarcina sp. SAFN-015 TaxID=3387274 RepID=UPI003F81D365